MDTTSALSAVTSIAGHLARRQSTSSQMDQDTRKLGRESAGAAQTQVVSNQTLLIHGATAPAGGDLSGRGRDRPPQQVNESVKHINDFFQMVRRTLHFSVNQDTGRVVIEVKDAETDEVIRQIPPENVLNLAKRLGEFKGLLFEGKV